MNETKHLKIKTVHRQFDTTHTSHDTVTLQFQMYEPQSNIMHFVTFENVCYEIYFQSISPWHESQK